MNATTIASLVFTGMIAAASAASAHNTPYATTIKCGEILTAELTFGESAAACTPGLDAIPGFTSVASYESYYQVDSAPNCDEDCLRPVYHSMKSSGAMRPLISGEHVTVTRITPDPNDKSYTICYVTTKHGPFLMACLGLAD